MIRSIRFTLALWYVGVLTSLLCAAGWVLYTSLRTSLERDIDNQLSLTASAISGNILSFWRAERGATGAGPGNWLTAPPATLEDAVDTGRMPELVNRWIEKAKDLGDLRGVRFLNRQGHPLLQTPDVPQLSLPDGLSVWTVPRSDVYETIESAGMRSRLITHPVLDGARLLFFVQVAEPLSQMDASLRQLRVWLMWLIPSTVLMTGLVGWLLASYALRPVGRMIQHVQELGVQQLDERLDVPRSGDELEHLAVTFNGMLARLEQSFRRLRQFSAAASHELRTPLTVMKGELEVALRKPREAEEYRRVLRTHLETIDDMTQTVEELLALGRSEAVEGAVARQPVELTELSRAVTQKWHTLARTKGVRLALRAKEPLWVSGERMLLERMLSNLLDNAVRHTPADGSVTVIAESRDGQACLEVQDTGPGIPLDELPQIFDRFFKRRSSQDDNPSTGLGLGLCRWIVEAHHGRLEVLSPPQQGATFTARLPLAVHHP